MKNLWYESHTGKKIDIKKFDMPLLDQPILDEQIIDDLEEKEQEETISFNIEVIEREAYERGFEAGEKAGFSLGEEKAKVLIDRVEALIRELITAREILIKELEPQILEVAVSIARKIIMKELTLNPDTIIEITKEAIMKLERTGPITIRINPLLYDLFIKHKPELLNIHPDIIFDVDPSLSKFSSVVMGPVEDVITDIDEQLKTLIKELADKSIQ